MVHARGHEGARRPLYAAARSGLVGVRRYPWLAFLVIFTATLFIYYLLIAVFGANYAEVCSKGRYGPPDNCSSYDIVSASFGRAFVFVDEHNGLFAAIASVAVAAFTGVLWIATEKLWRTSDAQIRLSARSFEAEHRPWMAIRDKEIPGSITVGNESATIPFSIMLENTGSTPARDFLMFGGGFPHGKKADVQALINDLIASSSKFNDLPSEIVFPGENTEHTTIINIDFLESDLRFPFYGGVIYGVFFYRSTFSEEYKHTTFTYALDVPQSLSRIDDDGRWPVIPPDKIQIRKWHTGWRAT